MRHYTVFLLSPLLTLSWAKQHLKFPDEFKFGAATAAYQVEGGAAERSENIWDDFIQSDPSRIADGSNASSACDSYHLWRKDVEVAAELGLQYYKFSISWSRLLPNAFSNQISEDGRRYYDNLIDALISKGVEPMITIYHFDLPTKLQQLGGWTNPLIIDWFSDYARVVFTLYGDRVKTWLTINEPSIVCDAGYDGIAAPAIEDSYGVHLCAKNLVLAHAKAWRIYDKEFKPKYHGRVSLGNLILWFEPETSNDVEVTELAREYSESRYGHPIYSKEGGFPPKVGAVITAYNRKSLNYDKWTLPQFTEEEIELVKGSYDFYAFNYYVSRLVRKSDKKLAPWPYNAPAEIGAELVYNKEWKHAVVGEWFQLYPEGLRKAIAWIRQRYGDMEIMITENGYPMAQKTHNDYERIECLRDHLYQLLLSIKEDGANVTGYIVWAMIDNFEWASGYSTNYGLYEVDFDSPLRTRRPRASAHYYSKVVASKDPFIDVLKDTNNNLI